MATTILRRAMAPLVAPAVFDFWVQKLDPALSWSRPLARVVRREVSARGAVTLHLKANGHFRGYRAGQHVPVTVEVNGVRLTRSYSPVTPWTGDGRLAITVKAIEGGKVSGALTRDVDVGNVLELGAAFGDMVLDAQAATQPWLLVAGGSGITPLMCQLRAMLSENAAADVVLMCWARERTECYYMNELAELARCHPGLKVLPVLTRETHLLPGELGGRPDAAHFLEHVPALAARRVHACGPWGFVDSVRALLADGVPAFASEAFTAPPRKTVSGEPVTVTLARSGRQLAVPAGAPLLESLEAQGVQPAYGCRMGVCNTCVCGKPAGTTTHIHTAETDSEAGQVRLCVNAPLSDLTLDL